MPDEVNPSGQIAIHTIDAFAALDLGVPYLIDPIMPKGGVGLIYGLGGSGKTQLWFSMMKALSEGTNLLGRWNVTQPCRVLSIQTDMAAGQFQERIIASLNEFIEPHAVMVVHMNPIDITNAADRKALRALVQASEADVVQYDTLHKLHSLDENAASTPRIVYDAWREAIDGRSSFLVHHSRKDAFNFKGQVIDSDQDLRGHSSWRDDSDLAIRMRKLSRTKVIMSITRCRSEDQEPMTLRFNPQTLMIEPKEPETARECLEMLLTQGFGPQDKTAWVKECMERMGVSKQVAYAQAAAVEMKLLEQGNI